MSMVAYLIMNDVHRSAIRTYAQSSRWDEGIQFSTLLLSYKYNNKTFFQPIQNVFIATTNIYRWIANIINTLGIKIVVFSFLESYSYWVPQDN